MRLLSLQIFHFTRDNDKSFLGNSVIPRVLIKFSNLRYRNGSKFTLTCQPVKLTLWSLTLTSGSRMLKSGSKRKDPIMMACLLKDKLSTSMDINLKTDVLWLITISKVVPNVFAKWTEIDVKKEKEKFVYTFNKPFDKTRFFTDKSISSLPYVKFNIYLFSL